MRLITFFLLFTFLIFSCNQNTEETKTTSSGTDQVEEKKEPAKFIVNIDQLRLRKEAGTEGEELTKLPMGTVLTDLEQISEFTTRIKLRGVQYNEPWLKVKVEEGQEGWVYAGGVRFDGANSNAKLLNRRLHSFFGKELTQTFNDYKKAYENIRTSTDFQTTYKMGTGLRDSMEMFMTNRIQVDDPQNLPDLFWIEEMMPGYIPHLVAEGTEFYFFKDYKSQMKKATQTADSADDDYVKLCYSVYAMDSIENFYPSWFMQTWDYGGESELGKGIHFKMLKQMDAILDKSTLFKDEIIKFKTNLVNDITDPNVSYWEAQEKIVKEVDDIINADFKVLSKEDYVSIKMKRKMFEQPEKNNIQVNRRSGFEN